MTPQQKHHIVRWVRILRAKRTKLIEDGQGRIDWLAPETRVSLTEVRSYADSIGVRLDVNDVADILNALQRKR